MLTKAEFADMFGDFTHTAFRLETRQKYTLSYEQESFEQFLAGQSPPPTEIDWWRPWLEHIAELTRQGKRVARVRVLAEPPTDYQRWGLWGGRWNTEAGEWIQYLPQSNAQQIELPVDSDWWLFDSTRLVIMHFDAPGNPTGNELITEPNIVAKHCEWRDLAVRHSTSIEGLAAA